MTTKEKAVGVAVLAAEYIGDRSAASAPFWDAYESMLAAIEAEAKRPPDPPVSVSERERALVRQAMAVVGPPFRLPGGWEESERQIIAAVDQTHPRPAVLVRQWARHVANVAWDDAKGGGLGPDIDAILTRVGPPPAAEDRAELGDPIAIAHAGLNAAHAETDRQRARADAAEARLAEMTRERESLRKALIDTGNALGASLGEACTTGFLCHVPEEAKLVVERLTRERDTLLKKTTAWHETLDKEINAHMREHDETLYATEAKLAAAIARAERAEGHVAALVAACNQLPHGDDNSRCHARSIDTGRRCLLAWGHGVGDETSHRFYDPTVPSIDEVLADPDTASREHDERVRMEAYDACNRNTVGSIPASILVVGADHALTIGLSLSNVAKALATAREEGAAEMRDRAVRECERGTRLSKDMTEMPSGEECLRRIRALPVTAKKGGA